MTTNSTIGMAMGWAEPRVDRLASPVPVVCDGFRSLLLGWSTDRHGRRQAWLLNTVSGATYFAAPESVRVA